MSAAPALDPTIGDDATADIAVDVEVDFCEGGSLAVAGGADVAARGSAYMARSTSAVKVATKDWHIDPGAHFAASPQAPDYVDTWPSHCVAGTTGSEFHQAFDPAPVEAVFYKGLHSAAYSGFEGATDEGQGASLDDYLKERGIRRVKIWGIALSHCVAATALDAVESGFETVVLLDLSVGVSPATTASAMAAMTAAGVVFMHSTTEAILTPQSTGAIS